MNSKFPYYINQGLIKSAGVKLKWIGYLITLNIILWGCFLDPEIFNIIDEIFGFSYSNKISIGKFIIRIFQASCVVSVVLLILAGRNLIQSTDATKANQIEMIPPITEMDDNGNTLTKYFFPNGNLNKVESYNKENKKNGWWEYYSPKDGKLKYKEFYENGDYKNVFRPE